MVTVKFSSSPPSLEEDTQGENVSAVINFGRTGGYLDQQSAHNELARKHHSSRNLKRKKKQKTDASDLFVSATRTSTPPSALSDMEATSEAIIGHRLDTRKRLV